MKDTINKDQFISWFRSSDTYRNNFSYEGLSALFNYLEEMEESTGEELEFDPIALCCEFSEYDSFYELVADYCPTEEDATIGYFEDRTTVLLIEEGIHKQTKGYIIQQF